MGANRSLYDRTYAYFTDLAGGRNPIPGHYDFRFTTTEFERDINFPADKGYYIATGINFRNFAAVVTLFSLRVDARDITGGLIPQASVINSLLTDGEWPAPVVIPPSGTLTAQVDTFGAGDVITLEGMFLPPDVLVPTDYCETQWFELTFPTTAPLTQVLRPRTLTYDGVLYDFEVPAAGGINAATTTLISLRAEPILRTPFLGPSLPIEFDLPTGRLVFPFKRNDQLLVTQQIAVAATGDVDFIFRALKPWPL